MDELLSALVGLIKTGGDLADDALYLYFTLKLISTWATAGPICLGLYLLFRILKEKLQTPDEKLRHNLLRVLSGEIVWQGEYRWQPSPDMFKKAGFEPIEGGPRR